MTSKKYLIIAVLATFCLTATLFMIVPTKSQSSTHDYDPWTDINDDGSVDMADISLLIDGFMSGGPPINKTTLLYNVNATFTELLMRIDNLNSSLTKLQSDVEGMNATNLMPLIDELNNTLTHLGSDVDYMNNTFELKMALFNNTLTALRSDVDYMNSTFGLKMTLLNANVSQLQSTLDSINNTLSSRISSLETQMATISASVSAMNATITALQNANAGLSSRISALEGNLSLLLSRVTNLESEIAVLNATKLGAPNYDSGWFSVTAGGSATLSHNLQTSNILVYMTGYDSNGYYIHQLDYGGDATGSGNIYGAWWCKLTATTIEIDRMGQDVRWQWIRVYMWKIPPS